jgi:hypothetical protein
MKHMELNSHPIILWKLKQRDYNEISKIPNSDQNQNTDRNYKSEK